MTSRPHDHIWRKVRLVVLARDNHLCQLKRHGCTTHATQVDHIIPVSEGGQLLDPSNLRASCAFCNLSRNATRNAELATAAAGGADAPPSRVW